MRIGKASTMTLASLCTTGFAALAAAEGPFSASGSSPHFQNPSSPRTDCICEYHDGSQDNSIGLTTGGLMSWSIPCTADVCGWVNGVEVAWGPIAHSSPVQILIQDDPNDDGDPGDAVTLLCVNVLTDQEDTGTLVYYPIPKTAVTGGYFVTISAQHVAGEYPAGIDQTASQGTSWASWGCPDPCDPYCGTQSYDLIDNYGLAGNWMVTVHSTDVPPEPPSGCPWDNHPYPGGNGEVDIDDLFGVLGHWGDCVNPDDCPWDCHPDNGGGSYGDGKVDIDDLFAILGHWGPCPSEPKACCFADGSCQDLTETDCDAAGGTYYGYYGTCAEFSCPQPPPNDTCENAQEMQIGDTVTGDTTGMTNPFIDGCVIGAPMEGPTLWYYVIGDGTTLTASLCNTGTADWDHVMSVFCGNCSSIMNSNMYCAGGNDVACQVPGENIWAPEVEWCSEEGVQYWIAVYGPSETPGNYGAFALSVTTNGVPCGNPPACSCELYCAGAQLEQEACGEDTNGGCNFDPNNPHAYEEMITCGVPVCGTAWADTSLRDTDWYLLDVPDLGGGGAAVTITFASQFYGLCGVLPDDCNATEFTDYTTSDLCAEATFTTWMWAGYNVVWAGPADWYDLPCGLGAEYKFTADCAPGEPPVICEYEQDPYCQLVWEGTTGISSTSSDAAGYTVADDFTYLATTQVNHVCWWGLNGHWSNGWTPGPCNTLFRIRFFNDDGNGCPGTVFAGPFNVTSSCEDTGVFYNAGVGNIYEFTATLPQTVTFQQNQCYWIEIVDRSVGDADYFLWTGSQEGEGSTNFYSLQDTTGNGYDCPTEYIAVNRSLCMGLGDPPVGKILGDPVICAGEVPFDGCQEYGGGTAANADENGGYHVADDFRFAVSTTVDQLRWWGIDYYFDGSAWVPCYQHNTEFHITYYVDSDNNGCPDNIVAEFDITNAGVDSGFTFNDATVWLWTANHADVTFAGNTCYWVEVMGINNDTCWFLWTSSNDFYGNDTGLQAAIGSNYVCPTNYTTYDLSWCMANNGVDVTLDNPANCVQ